jgi:hypothetical protein
MAELVAGVAVYLDQTGTPSTRENIKAILNAFMGSDVISADRPFYFHSSDEKLSMVYTQLADQGVEPRPTVLPQR